jgi:hypothetical protein
MEKFENFITIRLLMQGKVRISYYILKIKLNLNLNFFNFKEVGSIIGKVNMIFLLKSLGNVTFEMN